MPYSRKPRTTERSSGSRAEPSVSLIMDTLNIQHAEAEVSRLLSPHRLRLVSSTRQLHARLWGGPAQAIWLGHFGYGTDVDIRANELRQYFAINAPLAGTAKVTYAGQQVFTRPGIAAILSPEDDALMSLSWNLSLLCVRVNRTALEHRLAELLGREPAEPLRFDLGFDTMRDGSGWWGLTQLLEQYLSRASDAVSAPLVLSDLEHAILTSLLLSQRHTYTEALQTPAARPSSRAVRTAVELMQAHPDRPLTIAGIAEEVGVSERALQMGFRREYGSSPLAFLRQIRLDRVHQELLRHRASESATVLEIGLRWGFSNQGRLAAAYRQRFGETPAETLRGRASDNGRQASDRG